MVLMIIMTRNEINQYIHIPQYANHQPQFVSKKKEFNKKTTSRNLFRTCYELNNMHELDSKFKRQAKNDKNT